MLLKVIQDRILQGGYINGAEARELEASGVTDVLNLDIPYQNIGEMAGTRLRFHSVPLHDMGTLSPDQVHSLLDVMHEVLDAPDTRLYVHCSAGVSRSPTAIWLYLISRGVSQKEAARIIAPDGALLSKRAIDAAVNHGRHGT